MTNLDGILKSRHYFVNKGPSGQSYGFSSDHVWMLDYKESWALKNWRFWTVVLEQTVERRVWRFAKELKVEVAYGSAVPLPGIDPPPVQKTTELYYIQIECHKNGGGKQNDQGIQPLCSRFGSYSWKLHKRTPLISKDQGCFIFVL